MKRTMFQLYLNGCDAAIELYQNAFNATLNTISRNPDGGSVVHAELDVFGQCIAMSDMGADAVPGNTMQLCFHFGEGHREIIEKAYETLKDGAQISSPLDSCFYSPYMFSLVDKFGVNWCLFE